MVRCIQSLWQVFESRQCQVISQLWGCKHLLVVQGSWGRVAFHSFLPKRTQWLPQNGALFPEVERNTWPSSTSQWQFLYLEHPSNPPKLPLPQTDALPPPPSHTLTYTLTHTPSLSTCPCHVLLSPAHFKNWIAYLVLSCTSFFVYFGYCCLELLFANIFSQSDSCLFILLVVYFAIQKPSKFQ